MNSSERAGVVAVPRLQDVEEPLDLGARGRTAGRRSVDREPGRVVACGQVDVAEEERLVLDDAARRRCRRNCLSLELRRPCVPVRRRRRPSALVAAEVERRARESVACRSCVIALMPPPENPPWRTSYGETTSWSSWIASRLIGCALGLPAGRAGRREAEQVVVDRAVDLHVVVAVVAAGHRQRQRILVQRRSG